MLFAVCQLGSNLLLLLFNWYSSVQQECNFNKHIIRVKYKHVYDALLARKYALGKDADARYISIFRRNFRNCKLEDDIPKLHKESRFSW